MALDEKKVDALKNGNLGSDSPKNDVVDNDQMVVKDGQQVSISSIKKVSNDESGDSTRYKLTINGKEKEVTTDELVKLAQKGEAADEKFQKASEIQKNYDKLVKGLQDIKQTKNKEAIKKLFEIEFEDSVQEKESTKEVEITPLEKKMAERLGLSVNEFMEEKRQASGGDIPEVHELKKQVEMLSKKLDEIGSIKNKSEQNSQMDEITAQLMLDKFQSLSKQRGYNKKLNDIVIDYIEQNKIPYADYEKAFEYFDDIFEEGASKRYEKKKQMSEKPTSVNNAGSLFSTEDLTGLSIDKKAEALKKMLAGR